MLLVSELSRFSRSFVVGFNMGPTDALLRWAEREAARRPRPDTSRQRAALEARRERATDAYVAGARDRGWWQAETARIDGELAALPVAIHAELPAIGARVATLAQAWHWMRLPSALATSSPRGGRSGNPGWGSPWRTRPGRLRWLASYSRW